MDEQRMEVEEERVAQADTEADLAMVLREAIRRLENISPTLFKFTDLRGIL